MENYNYRLDNSNPEDTEDKYELRAQETKNNWNCITSFFLQKGLTISFKYWKEDVSDSTSNYFFSSYGITEIMQLERHYKLCAAEDGLMLLHVALSKEVIQFIIESMKEEHDSITPFFHFDIYDYQAKSIFTSQDNGNNVLMCLSKAEFQHLLSFNIARHQFIRLPERIDD
ncbi:hypothetical protein [Rummeliibacillus suwonensis]|uniref:hypothetical protein n=1 Tax=Rummeliibacillus suwonensis TaxID=1306154 RepID=UPI0011B4D216|nr:hypothetical protein [Rummeliibacillus suwonensis]